MGWGKLSVENTKKYLGSGGPVKCIDERYGTNLGIANVNYDGTVNVFEHAKTGSVNDFYNDNGVVIAKFSSVDDMIDGGWVID